MEAPTVVTLDGVTGAGKSELLSYIREHPSSRYVVPSKLTTRPRRRTDNSWEFLFVRTLPGTPDFLEWGSVRARYAVALDILHEAAADARTAVFICTDLDAVTSLARRFSLLHIYLFRPLEHDDLLRILRRRGTDPDQIRARMAEHASLGEDYLAKLPFVSATILNIGDIAYLRRQFDTLMGSPAA
ncbi:hypothetical protein GCM10023085_20870 [Actinomadura viridis]|uniref:Guanylate kinase n=1 Tax=Actinomadura viridis TaxID=58110 RepID=A0A931DFI9_9ACTN|nr:hypothetical protein [Actinomadura viridis]MBG6089155.1 guanylate kinase [Actinomadura viridis]